MQKIYEAEKLKNVTFSGIRKVVETVTRLEKSGQKIIHMEIGRPDFDTPTHIKEAAKKALDEGLVHYASNYGIPELRKAIAKKLNMENNINIMPDEVIVTVGANEAIFLSMMAFLNPGDEVLIPEPSWLHYFHCARLAGAEPVAVPLSENGFMPRITDLEKLISSRTKMIVVNTPGNPTGTVLDENLLREIAEFAQRHKLLVLADEIYEKIIYDDARHFSIASLPGMKERTITVNGFSKIYSMDGWRLGYLATDQKLIDALIRVHQYTIVCVCTFAQKGAVAALEGSQDCVKAMVAEFTRRRKLVVDSLKEMGVSFIEPKGAFYVFPDIRFTDMTSEEVSAYLLEEAKIATVPGSCFGDAGEGYIRMAFSSSYSDLEIGLESMKTALCKLRNF